MVDGVAAQTLRVDWLPEADADALPGRLGMTVLPGKHGASTRYPGRVYAQDLSRDLAALGAAEVVLLALLVEDAELRRWGDERLDDEAARRGIDVRRHPMPDGGVPASLDEMDRILDELRQARGRGNAAIACMGGVGRTGMVAACALVRGGMDPVAAIASVRRARHPQAVETALQEEFVRRYAARAQTR
jgi:protein-tyrosine phosphatase